MSNFSAMTTEQLKRALALAVEDGNEIIQYVIKKELKARETSDDGPNAA